MTNATRAWANTVARNGENLFLGREAPTVQDSTEEKVADNEAGKKNRRR